MFCHFLNEVWQRFVTFDPLQMEYEQHLVGIPRWRQQLQENTQETVKEMQPMHWC